MKYIKTYESITNLPDVGDYMIVDTNILDDIPNTPTPFQTLAFYRIGKIMSVRSTDFEQVLEIRVDYNISDVRSSGPPLWYEEDTNPMLHFDGKTYYIPYTIPLKSVIYSKNKEDLEYIVKAKKYNL